MASILGFRLENLNGDQVGKLIETFVFNALSAEADTSQDEYRLYHYRDRKKREADPVIK